MQITWNDLKRIGQSKLLQLTILIPIFGYMIFFNHELVSIVEKSTNYLYDKNIINSKILFTNSYKLYYLYFGFSLLGIASILYKIISPNLINEYLSLREYIEKESSIMNQNNTKTLFNRLKNEKVKGIEILQDNIIPVQSITENTIIDIMTINWKHNNTLYKKTKITIFLLYTFGFILIAIPSLKMFYNTIVIFIKI